MYIRVFIIKKKYNNLMHCREKKIKYKTIAVADIQVAYK